MKLLSYLLRTTIRILLKPFVRKNLYDYKNLKELKTVSSLTLSKTDTTKKLAS